MLVYPIAYTTLILPIAISRFLAWSGRDVPFATTIFADIVFLFSGFVNVLLFITTRRILPASEATSLFSRSNKSKSDIESQDSMASHVTPFVMTDKVIVSPLRTESHVIVPPIAIPAPVLQHTEPSHFVPKRTISLAPTVASTYSQSSADSPPPVPPIKFVPTPVQQLNTAPLPTRGDSQGRVGLSEKSGVSEETSEDLGNRKSWSEESYSSYSSESEYSPTIRPPPRPLVLAGANAQHSKSPSLSSIESASKASGPRF